MHECSGLGHFRRASLAGTGRERVATSERMLPQRRSTVRRALYLRRLPGRIGMIRARRHATLGSPWIGPRAGRRWRSDKTERDSDVAADFAGGAGERAKESAGQGAYSVSHCRSVPLSPSL